MQPFAQQPPSMPSQAPGLAPPAREVTPPQIKLAGSGYASSQALLDSMFPELGASAPAQGAGGNTADFPGVAQQAPRPTPEELDRMQAIQERIAAKIAAMAEHNHLMGNSDKDFITRIQLSQLATSDPYTSDFYAQVFSAIRGPRPGPEGQGGNVNAGPGNGKNDGPKDIVQVAPGYAFGVSGPAGNRFGKMGQQTMQKLSTQVKKLVESRDLKYKSAQNAGESLNAIHAMTKLTNSRLARCPRQDQPRRCRIWT
jgi:DNA topoisomerase 2-associated protein PAT1